MMTRRRIGKPCIDCGRTTSGGSRCPKHEEEHETERQARQWYRAVYESPEYRRARAARKRMAGGQCEAIVELGPPNGAQARCPAPGVEAHHLYPLSTARTLEEALALCTVEKLRW